MTSPAKGYFPELLHGNGVGEESDVGFATADLLHRFGCVAQIAKVGLVADLFGVKAEQTVEDDGVQVAQVELTLALGHVGQGDGRWAPAWSSAGTLRRG